MNEYLSDMERPLQIFRLAAHAGEQLVRKLATTSTAIVTSFRPAVDAELLSVPQYKEVPQQRTAESLGRIDK